MTRNSLDDRIAIGANDPAGPIFPAQLATLCPKCVARDVYAERCRIDFTLCNPPFYSSAAEIDALAAEKDHSPLAVRCPSSDRR